MFVSAPREQVFAVIDQPACLAGHMSKRSWKMGGGRMELEIDSAGGRRPGSRMRLHGRVFGVPLSVDSEGGMFGFFFAAALPQHYGAVMATDKARFNRFFHAMLDRGVYFAPALYEAGFVSAAHREEDIAATVAAAREAFAQAGDERIP